MFSLLQYMATQIVFKAKKGLDFHHIIFGLNLTHPNCVLQVIKSQND